MVIAPKACAQKSKLLPLDAIRCKTLKIKHMIIISAGMQKSGSAYIYNLINDILISSGKPDAREVKEKNGLNDVMKWHNNNVGHLGKKLLTKLILLSLKEGTFTVKTHSGPTGFQKILHRIGLIKTIYIYRDPRDVLLSAQDHGKKIIAAGDNHTFAQMIDFDDAFNNVKVWTNIFNSYKKANNVLLIRYEDLMGAPIKEMQKICSYLNVNLSEKKIKEILAKYDRGNPNANMTGLHFNKGITNRYKTELTQPQMDRFITDLGSVIEKMGYDK